MQKEVVGSVTEEEKKEVLRLHERKIALEELIITLSNPSLSNESREMLYEKIVDDMAKTKMGLQSWWDAMYRKYNWKSAEGGSWNIDFQTNEIVLGTG